MRRIRSFLLGRRRGARWVGEWQKSQSSPVRQMPRGAKLQGLQSPALCEAHQAGATYILWFWRCCPNIANRKLGSRGHKETRSCQSQRPMKT